MFETIKADVERLTNIDEPLSETKFEDLVDLRLRIDHLSIVPLRMDTLHSWTSNETHRYKRHSSFLRDYGILNCILWVGLFLYVVTRKKTSLQEPGNGPEMPLQEGEST